jgi:hypothetical protein
MASRFIGSFPPVRPFGVSIGVIITLPYAFVPLNQEIPSLNLLGTAASTFSLHYAPVKPTYMLLSLV